MSKLIACGVVMSVLAGSSSADLVTYEYTGTVHTNTHWGSLHGLDVTMRLTVDTSVLASSLTETRAEYQGAIVGGFMRVGEMEWDVNPEGLRNSVILRTDVYDQNFQTYSNRLNMQVSVIDVPQNGFQFAGNISMNVTDNDDPADTITGLGMVQPLDTLSTISGGGVDQFSLGLGISNGVSATILSGDGGFRIVPSPAGVAVFGVAGLFGVRRRR